MTVSTTRSHLRSWQNMWTPRNRNGRPLVVRQMSAGGVMYGTARTADTVRWKSLRALITRKCFFLFFSVSRGDDGRWLGLLWSSIHSTCCTPQIYTVMQAHYSSVNVGKRVFFNMESGLFHTE